jgi:hypothetical protein
MSRGWVAGGAVSGEMHRRGRGSRGGPTMSLVPNVPRGPGAHGLLAERRDHFGSESLELLRLVDHRI